MYSADSMVQPWVVGWQTEDAAIIQCHLGQKCSSRCRPVNIDTYRDKFLVSLCEFNVCNQMVFDSELSISMSWPLNIRPSKFLTIFDLTTDLSFWPQNQNSYLCSPLHVSCNVNLVKYAQVVWKILCSLFTDARTCSWTLLKNWMYPMANCPHWWHGGGAYGLWRSSRFPLRNPKGRRLSRVSQFGPQNMVYGGANLRDHVQSMCLQRILAIPLLVSILRSWHQGSWNEKWQVYLQHLCCLWLFSCLRATPVTNGGEPSSNGYSRGLFPQSHPRRASKLWGRLEKYACLLVGTFFSAQMYVLSTWVPGHIGVPGNVTYVFYHNNGMLVHIYMEVYESY